MLGLVAGGVALEQAIPLGRVWSFPKEIVLAKPLGAYSLSADSLLPELATDLWGANWTAQDIRNADFKIKLYDYKPV